MLHRSIRVLPLSLLFLAGLCLGLPADRAELWGPEALWADDAEEAAEEEEDGDAPRLSPCPDDKVKDLVSALKKAAKKRKTAEVMPALDAIDEYEHKDFLKPLLKMATHGERDVARRAAAMLEWRVRGKKSLSSLLKVYDHKNNKRRFLVKGRIWKTLARAGRKLSKSDWKMFERDWRWLWQNPQKEYAEGIVLFTESIELNKDVRAFRGIAEQLTNPNDRAINVNSPSNPPAEWHERFFYMWQPTKPALVAALKAMTGQEFDRTEEAKTWAEEHGKKLKIEW